MDSEMTRSQNGYSANDISVTQMWTIGNERKIRLRQGSAGWILKHMADWFDKNIENIDSGKLDDWGYAERPIRGSSTVSNHASGTAMDLNATRHPMGKRNTFSNTQEAKIRTQLKRYEGCIRWGGDYTSRADEMHFEINKGPSDVVRVAKKLGRK
jgi:hypothetical protein